MFWACKVGCEWTVRVVRALWLLGTETRSGERAQNWELSGSHTGKGRGKMASGANRARGLSSRAPGLTALRPEVLCPKAEVEPLGRIHMLAQGEGGV